MESRKLSGQDGSSRSKSNLQQQARTLAAARKHVVRSLAAAEQVIRGLLRPLGLKVGVVTRTLFEAPVRELVACDAMLAATICAPSAALASAISDCDVASRRSKLGLSSRASACLCGNSSVLEVLLNAESKHSTTS